MMKLSCFALKLQCVCSFLCYKLSCFWEPVSDSTVRVYRFILRRFNSFIVELFYFIFLSIFGFFVLKAFSSKSNASEIRDLDLFFTSVSAATVSSMSTVEMEVFSHPQLVFITILMFIGGEVFTSMLGLFLRIHDFEFRKVESKIVSVNSLSRGTGNGATEKTLEDGQIETLESGKAKRDSSTEELNSLVMSSTKLLAIIVLGYVVIVHVLGITFVSVYLAVSSSASNVLRTKGLNPFTFSVFTVVSTFASCGFIPTNENMIVFRQNSALLLILIPQVFLGNTLYPPFLRISIVAVSKFFKNQKNKINFLLENYDQIKYLHLFSGLRCRLIAGTVLGFILIQFVMFLSMEWDSDVLEGLDNYQKFAGSLFMSVNSRHTGETTVDLSVISPAIMVLFVIMMFLPPYTSFVPLDSSGPEGQPEIDRRKETKLADNMILSQLSYLAIFVVLICITERDSIREDPINFSVINIVVEIVSAYGNVGFTAGYSCGKRVRRDGVCEDMWYGFVGRWSDQGKALLIIVMLLGRLKMFNMRGGKPWKLL